MNSVILTTVHTVKGSTEGRNVKISDQSSNYIGIIDALMWHPSIKLGDVTSRSKVSLTEVYIQGFMSLLCITAKL